MRRLINSFSFLAIFFAISTSTVFAAVQPGPTFQVTHTTDANDGVCEDTHCTLREAIIAADAYAGSIPTVNIPAGNYPLTSSLPSINGDEMIISGAGMGTTILEANDNNLFRLPPNRTTALTLENLTLNNVRDGFDIQGQLDLLVSNVALTGNLSGMFYIENALATGNSIFDNLQIQSITSSGISVFQFFQSNMTIRNSSITNSDLKLLIIFGSGANNQYIIENTTLSGNTFFPASPTPNYFIEFLDNSESVLTLRHVTIADNENIAFAQTGNSAAAVFLDNSIFADNRSGGIDNDCAYLGSGGSGSEFYFVVDNSIIEHNNCPLSIAAPFNGELPMEIDPLLWSLADNGGNTLTHALATNSPAINAYVCNSLTDQRGVSRPQGAACDLGAFELEGVTLAVPQNLSVTATDDSSISLSWDDIIGETNYYLERSDDNGATWTELPQLAADTIAYTDTILSCDTAYQYRLRAYDSATPAFSEYSQVVGASTTVCALTAPSNLSLVSGINLVITMSWDDNTGAETAYLVERSEDNQASWSEIATLSANSTQFEDGFLTCSTTYHYRVRAYNSVDASYSGYSNVLGHSTLGCNDPGYVETLIAPVGTIANAYPVFQWQPTINVTWYYLWTNTPNGQYAEWLDAASYCTASLCSYTMNTAFADGAYQWALTASNATGESGWSAVENFTVSGGMINPVTVIGPGDSDNPNPIFSWNAEPGATWYYLWVSDAFGFVHAQWYRQSVVCNAGVCSVTPALDLVPGTYRFWIQHWGPVYNYGPWTAEQQFSMTASPLPATLLSPSGMISETQPTLVWEGAGGATWHYLWLSNANGTPVLNTWYSGIAGSGICDNAGICSVTPAVNLSDGYYLWWILGWGPGYGYGPWSSMGSFQVELPVIDGNDRDGDGLTDAWEYARFGCVLDGTANTANPVYLVPDTTLTINTATGWTYIIPGTEFTTRTPNGAPEPGTPVASVYSIPSNCATENISETEFNDPSEWAFMGCTDPNPDQASTDDILTGCIIVALDWFTSLDDPDGDACDNGCEEAFGTSPMDYLGSAPGDTDDDGLTDAAEVGLGTDPHNPDSDGDGIWDGSERCELEDGLGGCLSLSTNIANPYPGLWTKTDPLLADTDRDNLDDGDEVDGTTAGYFTDPLDPDTDDDGISDGDEINGFVLTLEVDGIVFSITNVTTNATIVDSDTDGISDGDEVNGFTITNAIDGTITVVTNPANLDTDNDGLCDGAGCVTPADINPIKSDTDGDSLNDFDEQVTYSLLADNVNTDGDICVDIDGNPQPSLEDGEEMIGALAVVAGSDPDADGNVNANDLDSDGDTLSDCDEVYIYGTNPYNADSDGDAGFSAFATPPTAAWTDDFELIDPCLNPTVANDPSAYDLCR